MDVVEIQSIGPSYDDFGCTSFSFSAYVAARIYWAIPPEYQPVEKPHNRPRYWSCDPFIRQLNKTLEQPWFAPFRRPAESFTRPMQLHREALKHVLRTDVHDRPDVWFVREDGTNLDQVLSDVTAVVESTGLGILERFHDPKQVVQMANDGELHAPLESPVTQRIVQAALAQLGKR